MTPNEPTMTPTEPGTPGSGVTANVLDIVEALQRSLLPGYGSAEDPNAYVIEAESIMQRLDRELAVEEALTRQLMVRHGL